MKDADKTRTQVRDVFARVLRRDPDVRTSVLGPSFGSLTGNLLVELRDSLFVVQVGTHAQLSVDVYKTTRAQLQDAGIPLFTNPYFRYNCPSNRMGKLRKIALILLKKMQHVEVYEVMIS
jgi:hypothetical protein